MKHTSDTKSEGEKRPRVPNPNGRIAFKPKGELREWLRSKIESREASSFGDAAQRMLDRMMYLEKAGHLPSTRKYVDGAVSPAS